MCNIYIYIYNVLLHVRDHTVHGVHVDFSPAGRGNLSVRLQLVHYEKVSLLRVGVVHTQGLLVCNLQNDKRIKK